MCQNLKTYVQSDCFSSLILLFYGVVVVSLSLHERSMGDIIIFGQNSLNLNFEHCVN